MDGLFGAVRGERADGDPPRMEAPSPPDCSGRDSGRGATVWHAHGWARSVRCADGLHVAGATHLVGPTNGCGDPLEVVAEFYRKFGVDAFARLHGQFCLALYDERERRLVLAVDRFATRPIYYEDDRGVLRFGSSLRRVAAGRGHGLDHQAILEYLLYTAIPAPRTAFVGVSKLPAGHVLSYDRGGVRVTPYWDVTYREHRNGDVGSWARQLRAEIEAAVARYVAAEESPGDVGAFLSGGTDSSTVSGMIGRITGRPARTFSIGYLEEGYDELSYARIASRWFGTEQHEWKLSAAEALAALPSIVGYYQEPFGNASALPTYRCAQLARDHGVTVLFAGDGGDELFAGNTRYGTDKVFSLYEGIPRMVRRGVIEPALSLISDDLPLFGRARRYVRRANIRNPKRMLSYAPMVAEPLTNLVTEDFLSSVAADQLLATAEAHYRRPCVGTSELNRLMYVDLKMAIADSDVPKVSGMTELAGVQVRYPFLDDGLAEFAGRIPSALKLRGLQKRYIFKQALADFLPPEVLSKPKHGFGAPVAVWMRTDPHWRGFVGDLLHDPRTRQRGYIKPTVLDDLWRQVEEQGESFYGDSLWPWLMLELWHREHVETRRPE
jgi:asparagine synthase (glutamine-hydrolysing)